MKLNLILPINLFETYHPNISSNLLRVFWQFKSLK